MISMASIAISSRGTVGIPYATINERTLKRTPHVVVGTTRSSAARELGRQFDSALSHGLAVEWGYRRDGSHANTMWREAGSKKTKGPYRVTRSSLGASKYVAHKKGRVRRTGRRPADVGIDLF